MGRPLGNKQGMFLAFLKLFGVVSQQNVETIHDVKTGLARPSKQWSRAPKN
jgi:hypothetical protein